MGKFKFMLPCDEANHVCDKTQYNNATLWEKIKLNAHLLYCRACRKYSSKNSQLTKLIKKADLECLDTNVKSEMKKNLQKALQETTK